jgi:hypothetical protein
MAPPRYWPAHHRADLRPFRGTVLTPEVRWCATTSCCGHRPRSTCAVPRALRAASRESRRIRRST